MGPPAREPARKERRLSTARPDTNGNDKPSGPRSRKGVETRARLIAAAKEIFERDGFLDARISDIAEKAGLSHGSFYHYFESKEEVFREVVAEMDERLSAPMTNIVLDPNSPLSPFDRLQEAMRLWLEAYRDEARIMGVIEQVSRFDPEVAASRFERQQVTLEEIAHSIRSLQRRGLIDERLDPTITAAALGAMTRRFPEAWLVEHVIDDDFDDVVEQFTFIFARALGLDVRDIDLPRATAARRPGSAARRA
jgi:AcrR family transcriptional regulator